MQDRAEGWVQVETSWGAVRAEVTFPGRASHHAENPSATLARRTTKTYVSGCRLPGNQGFGFRSASYSRADVSTLHRAQG